MKYSSALERWKRAFRYAMGRTTIDDAWQFYHNACTVTGWRALEGISETSVLAFVADRYGDHVANEPKTERLVSYACARVADKWYSTGDTTSAAEEWAMELIEENAAEFGVTLKEVEAVA